MASALIPLILSPHERTVLTSCAPAYIQPQGIGHYWWKRGGVEDRDKNQTSKCGGAKDRRKTARAGSEVLSFQDTTTTKERQQRSKPSPDGLQFMAARKKNRKMSLRVLKWMNVACKE